MATVMAMVAGMLLAGCSGFDVTWFPGFAEPCTVCDGAEIIVDPGAIQDPAKASYICTASDRLGVSPCGTHKALVSIAKEYVVLSGDAEEAAADLIDFLETQVRPRIAAGASFGDIKLLVFSAIVDFNKTIGGTVLVLSDLAVRLPDAQLIPPYDVNLLNMAIDDIVAKVRDFAILIG